ncbi:MAG: carboxymuconolactone decarboxylase family protein [Gemmatimonadaceae bacterium]
MPSTIYPRFDIDSVAPGAERALGALDHFVAGSGLDPTLLELVRVRASQINGCSYCIDMHTKDARARGETEQRLYALAAWRETPFFTDEERAALAWTEQVTLVADGHVPDAVYEEIRERFTEADVATLTMAVIAINAWNRVAISQRSVPGDYVSNVHAGR